MRLNLKNNNEKLFNDLAKKVDDINERTIYANVQLCLTKDCKAKGEYFIPDFIAVKKTKNDRGQDIFDVVILDSKLNEGTNWTPNQGAGQKLNNYNIKGSISNEKVIKGKHLDDFEKEAKPSLVRNKEFIKIFSDGNGNYSGIK